MTAERVKAINQWVGKYCKTCVNNNDHGTEYINCQAEWEVQKDVGIACIHYEEYVEDEE